MAKIIHNSTLQPDRKRMLLRAGLSIFLFLQIHMPNVADTTFDQLTSWSIRQTISQVKFKEQYKKDAVFVCCREIASFNGSRL
ncbi:MAG TPA: hypothetical protein VK927_06275 [Adhaeribacter sp.]|nr:hypothetical protein [Adhaeribacter sp.]